MKTASEPSSSPEDICRAAAKIYASQYWPPLSSQTKNLVHLLEMQGYLEPRSDDSVYVGRAIEPEPEVSTQMELLHVSV